jgi:hypothetical protein
MVAGESAQNRHLPLDHVVGFLHDGQFAGRRWGHKNPLACDEKERAKKKRQALRAEGLEH